MLQLYSDRYAALLVRHAIPAAYAVLDDSLADAIHVEVTPPPGKQGVPILCVFLQAQIL